MTVWHRLTLVSLVAALTGCGNSAKPLPASGPDQPQEILKDFEMHDVRDGIRAMTLKSIEGRVFDTKQITDLTNPIATFYKNGQYSSRLTAPQGRVYMDTHNVEAWGGVTVVNTDSATLTTDRLNYDPKAQKIYSKDAVTLDKPDSITQGVGLETDPELKQVKIGNETVRFKHVDQH